MIYRPLNTNLESYFGQSSFPTELRANMEKIRDLDECVETEKARATSLREVSCYVWIIKRWLWLFSWNRARFPVWATICTIMICLRTILRISFKSYTISCIIIDASEISLHQPALCVIQIGLLYVSYSMNYPVCYILYVVTFFGWYINARNRSFC